MSCRPSADVAVWVSAAVSAGSSSETAAPVRTVIDACFACAAGPENDKAFAENEEGMVTTAA